VTTLATVDDLLALLGRGHTVFDEPHVDGLSHALQCGALLRAEHPSDPELAVAGLVHDVSDIADPTDHRDHDRRGALLVAPLLGERVARLVGAHVVAKRYLVATDDAYRSQLSVRSVETLADQGDALDDGERAQLASDPDIDAILALRRADERAKDPHASVPGLDSWRGLLDQVAEIGNL
jgi:predicted HD phosphohydrolase